MFKALLFSLALASGLHATVNNTTPIEDLNGGINGGVLVPVGTPVYALSQALTGVPSAAVDLSGTAGLWACVTSTGAANVTFYYSNQAVSQPAGAVSSYSINSNGCYPVEAKGRYVSFYNSSAQASNKVSLNYLPLVAPPFVISGSSTVVFPAGSTVTAYQGTSPWVISGNTTDTQGSGLPSAANAWRFTPTGVLPITSTATLTLVTYTATALNLSSVAGASAVPYDIQFGGTGAAAGFKWKRRACTETITPITAGTYVAASATAIEIDNAASGTCLDFMSTGSSGFTLEYSIGVAGN